MSDRPAGLRERKKHKTRMALAEAAMRLFEERGYEATTVAEIAAAAEVSTRTFFAYFPTKEDVFFAGTQDRLAAVREALRGHASSMSPLSALRVTFDEMVESTMDDIFGPSRSTRARLLMERPELGARGTQLLIVAHRVVTEQLRASYPDTEPIRLAATSGAAIGALIGVVMHGLADGLDPAAMRDAVDDALRQLEAGLGGVAEPG